MSQDSKPTGPTHHSPNPNKTTESRLYTLFI